MLVNCPPTYTVPPVGSIVSTALSGAGFQAVAAPVTVLTAPALVRGWPPMLVMKPPAYRVVPSRASESTEEPVAPGFQLVGTPVVASTAASMERG